MSDNLTPQERFNKTYITGKEIEQELGVQRSTILNARRKGLLPDPILVTGLGAFIWERELAEPYIKAWKTSLAFRRGELA